MNARFSCAQLLGFSLLPMAQYNRISVARNSLLPIVPMPDARTGLCRQALGHIRRGSHIASRRRPSIIGPRCKRPPKWLAELDDGSHLDQAMTRRRDAGGDGALLSLMSFVKVKYSCMNLSPSAFDILALICSFS